MRCIRPDGTMRPHVMRLIVTTEDIAQGVPHSAGRCPIARALKRRGLLAVSVGRKGAYLGYPYYAGAMLSPRATAFIERFDQGEPVDPLTFVLHWQRFDDA